MKKGELANRAVEATISNIESLRLNHEAHLDRIVFCFPRIRTSLDAGWADGSALAMAAAVIAREPEKRVDMNSPLRHYDEKHSIPSLFVPLNGIEDVEYHVSRKNMERLLQVGCIVFQPYRKGFGMRIPYDHPMYTGQPFSFETSVQ